MKISSDTPMDVYFYDLPTAIQKRNRHIFPSSTTRGLKIVNLPDVFAKTGYQSELLVAGECLSCFILSPKPDSDPKVLLHLPSGLWLTLMTEMDSLFSRKPLVP